MIQPNQMSPSGGAEDTPARYSEGRPSIPEPFPLSVIAGTTGSPDTQADALESMAHASTLPFEEEVEPGLPNCQRCEVLPRPLAGPGILHLNLPHTHTVGKVMRWLLRS